MFGIVGNGPHMRLDTTPTHHCRLKRRETIRDPGSPAFALDAL